jgi:hypothetical protein
MKFSAPSELGGDPAKAPAMAEQGEQGLGVFEDAGAGVFSGGGSTTNASSMAILLREVRSGSAIRTRPAWPLNTVTNYVGMSDS